MTKNSETLKSANHPDADERCITLYRHITLPVDIFRLFMPICGKKQVEIKRNWAIFRIFIDAFMP